MAIEIFRSVERIVSFRDIKCENRRVKLGLIPTAEFHGFGELLAVNADLPRKQAIGIDFRFSKFVYGGFVAARKGIKREASVFIEPDKMIVPLGWSFRLCVERVGHVLYEKGAIVLKVRPQIARQRVDCLIDNNFLSIASPSAYVGWEQRERRRYCERGVQAPSEWSDEHESHFRMPTQNARRATCCVSAHSCSKSRVRLPSIQRIESSS